MSCKQLTAAAPDNLQQKVITTVVQKTYRLCEKRGGAFTTQSCQSRCRTMHAVPLPRNLDYRYSCNCQVRALTSVNERLLETARMNILVYVC